ncbi:MAG TPA: ATP-binding protein [Sporichthya sp.]|nr:ATP-binding protein [Sporichthya sp.]
MCDQSSLALPPALRAAGAARRFAAAECRRWGLQSLCEDVALTLSEVVTNALVHAESPAKVTLSLTAEYLEVAVSDDSPRTPIVRPARVDLNADIDALLDRAAHDPRGSTPPGGLHIGPSGSIAGGRGMLIVDAVADEWGVTARSSGKEVWFRLRTPADRPAVSCLCPTSSIFTPGGLPLST